MHTSGSKELIERKTETAINTKYTLRTIARSVEFRHCFPARNFAAGFARLNY